MPTIAGNQADIGLAIQSAQGTPATAAAFRTYLTGGGLAAARTSEDIAETTAGRLRNDSFVGMIGGDVGTPAFAVRPNIIGIALYAAMGAKAVTGSTDPWTHTFTLNPTQPWVTAFMRLGPGTGGLYTRFSDAKVSNLTIASTAAGIMTATMGLVAAKIASKAAPDTAVTAETGAAFLHSHGSGALQIEGSALTVIESFEIAIGLGAAAIQGSDVTPATVSEGLQDITITTTELIQDFALWNRMIYGTSSPADNTAPVAQVLELAGSPAGLDFKFTMPGSPERSIEFLAPRVQVNVPPTDPNTDATALRRTVTYKVYQPAAAASGLTVKLKNATTSY